MFVRMIAKAFLRQWKKMMMIAFTLALGASLATAMLCVMMDVEDKMNQELKAYGANISVVPKSASVINDLYDVGDENISGTYLKEDELGKIKTIFWAFNIVDYAPFVNVSASLDDGSSVTAVGRWITHRLYLRRYSWKTAMRFWRPERGSTITWICRPARSWMPALLP